MSIQKRTTKKSEDKAKKRGETALLSESVCILLI